MRPSLLDNPFVGPSLEDAARALSILLGGASGALALAVWATGERISVLAAWVERVVGPVFLAGLTILTLLALLAAIRLWRRPADPVWLVVGLQAASGIATLALTFTLLGIGLGISSLAEAPIGPETVGILIATLTGRFALAFATTIVGLPLAACLRAVLLVLRTRSVPGGEAA